MTTLELEIALMKSINIRQNLIVPNVSNWSGLMNFEADVLSVSKSGYATCYELKISKSDLKKDLEKPHIKRLGSIMINGKSAIEFYYNWLKYFYYVVPENLREEALNQIPSFAGLLIAKRYPNSYFPDKIFFKEIKKPHSLFPKKWTLELKYQLARLGALRIVGLKEKLLSLL